MESQRPLRRVLRHWFWLFALITLAFAYSFVFTHRFSKGTILTLSEETFLWQVHTVYRVSLHDEPLVFNINEFGVIKYKEGDVLPVFYQPDQLGHAVVADGEECWYRFLGWLAVNIVVGFVALLVRAIRKTQLKRREALLDDKLA